MLFSSCANPAGPSVPLVNPVSGLAPMQVLNTRSWKLTAWEGSTPSLKEYTIGGSPDLWTYSDSRWFYADQTWAYFEAYAGYPTTSGSSNPRCELRERNASGSTDIYWNITGSTLYKMEWISKIIKLPSSGKLCFGQIHAKSSTWDDLIRVQIRGSANATSGTGTLYIMGWVTGDSADDIESYTLGNELHLEIVAGNGRIKLNRVNGDGTRTQLRDYAGSTSPENYFKHGNYLQSTPSSGSGIVATRLLVLSQQ